MTATITPSQLYSGVGRELNVQVYKSLLLAISYQLGFGWVPQDPVSRRPFDGHIKISNDKGQALSLFLPVEVPPRGTAVSMRLEVTPCWDGLPPKAKAMIPADELNRRVIVEPSKGGAAIGRVIKSKLLEPYLSTWEETLKAYQQSLFMEQEILANAAQLARMVNSELEMDATGKTLPRFNHSFEPGNDEKNVDLKLIVNNAGKVNLSLKNLPLRTAKNLLFLLNNPDFYSA
jgi:hypothetical protein